MRESPGPPRQNLLLHDVSNCSRTNCCSKSLRFDVKGTHHGTRLHSVETVTQPRQHQRGFEYLNPDIQITTQRIQNHCIRCGPDIAWRKNSTAARGQDRPAADAAKLSSSLHGYGEIWNSLCTSYKRIIISPPPAKQLTKHRARTTIKSNIFVGASDAIQEENV